MNNFKKLGSLFKFIQLKVLRYVLKSTLSVLFY